MCIACTSLERKKQGHKIKSLLKPVSFHHHTGSLPIDFSGISQRNGSSGLSVYKCERHSKMLPSSQPHHCALITRLKNAAVLSPRAGAEGHAASHIHSSAMVKTSLCQQQPLAQDSFWVTVLLSAIRVTLLFPALQLVQTRENC